MSIQSDTFGEIISYNKKIYAYLTKLVKFINNNGATSLCFGLNKYIIIKYYNNN